MTNSKNCFRKTQAEFLKVYFVKLVFVFPFFKSSFGQSSSFSAYVVGNPLIWHPCWYFYLKGDFYPAACGFISRCKLKCVVVKKKVKGFM